MEKPRERRVKATELVRLRRGALRVDERAERALRRDEGSPVEVEAVVEATERRMARIIAAEGTRREDGWRGGGRDEEEGRRMRGMREG